MQKMSEVSTKNGQNEDKKVIEKLDEANLETLINRTLQQIN